MFFFVPSLPTGKGTPRKRGPPNPCTLINPIKNEKNEKNEKKMIRDGWDPLLPLALGEDSC